MEFKAKTLDLAINEACTYFGVNREKLEIEIISDAKSGIFGLVGVKKATVKARRMRLDSGDDLTPRDVKNTEQGSKPASDKRGSEHRKPRQERESTHKGRVQDNDDASYSGTVAEAASKAIARPASEAFGPFGTDAEDTVEPAARTRPEGRQSREPREPRESREPREAREPREPREERQERTPRRSSEKLAERGTRSRDTARDNAGGGTSSDSSPRRQQDGRDRKRAQPLADRPQGRNSRANDAGLSQPRTEGERQGRAASASRSPRGRFSDKVAPSQMFDTLAPGEDGLLLEDEVCNDGFAPLNIESVGAERVIEETSKVVLRLVESIVDNPTCTVEITSDSRIKVMIDAGDSSGLLIGRYSQTLTAIQYIASRVLSRVFGAAARMQIDAGDYRERQDDKMRELALSLAERVKEEGRGLYTRPLSSYHRRVVHVTLQDDPELQTRSKGDGAMKRVLITLKRR